jgi:hypothetical protein
MRRQVRILGQRMPGGQRDQERHRAPLADSDLSDEDKAGIAHGNAGELLGLG